MKTYKEILAISEDLGWQVTKTTDTARKTWVEFQRYTKRGRDFVFECCMNNGNINELINGVQEYTGSFDIDTETYMWLDSDGHGKNGAPYHIEDILEDSKEIESELNKLINALRK